jgi:polyisoprenoid-binding protein YceI
MNVVEQLVPDGAWKADVVHSSVRFEVKHMDVSIYAARFTELDVALFAAPGGIELLGKVPVESVDIQDEVLRAHVLAPDFLDAERYPTLLFRSSDVRQEGDQIVVDGDLTIKGTTRTIEVRGTLAGPISDPFGNDRIALSLETVVDRTDFGLDYKIELPNGVSALADEVRLLVTVELVKDQ